MSETGRIKTTGLPDGFIPPSASIAPPHYTEVAFVPDFTVIGSPPIIGSTVYVAGPMTGLPDYNVHAFLEAKAVLEKLRLKVSIPPELCPFEEGKSYTDYFRADIKGMMECDTLVLLPGWGQSPGARAEMTLAGTMGMPIYFLIPGRGLLVDMNLSQSKTQLSSQLSATVINPSGQ